ncbi:unnamed protein product [Linum tenue]|uniref:Uncharacterized protein n=1 Tax=Linum tenue TaxID=586396 RepID=A0AAV0L765_9ROSI|nr:unnamed protein product [Linum tenue]
MSRLVLNSNNLFLLPVSDRTIRVLDPEWELNTQTITNDMVNWKHAGRVGNNSASTHRELQVFGTVIGGSKLEELSTELINLQAVTNREGCTVMYFNVGAGDMYLREGRSQVRRLNDLFDWSKYGVNVPAPVETVWDRFQQVASGKLMVDNKGAAQKQKELEEKEEESERVRAEQDKQIDELKKQAKEKDDQLAARDKQVASLKNALQALL